MFDHKKWTKTKIDNSTQQYVLFDKIILITYQNWNGVPNKVGRVNRLNMIGNDKIHGRMLKGQTILILVHFKFF